jgi:hypothetical protein
MLCCEQDCPAGGYCEANCELTLDADICEACLGSTDGGPIPPRLECTQTGTIEAAISNCVLKHEQVHLCEFGESAADACPWCETERNAYNDGIKCWQQVWDAYCVPASEANEDACKGIEQALEASLDAQNYFTCLCDNRIPGTHFYKEGTCTECAEYDSTGELTGTYCDGFELTGYSNL